MNIELRGTLLPPRNLGKADFSMSFACLGSREQPADGILDAKAAFASPPMIDANLSPTGSAADFLVNGRIQ